MKKFILTTVAATALMAGVAQANQRISLYDINGNQNAHLTCFAGNPTQGQVGSFSAPMPRIPNSYVAVACGDDHYRELALQQRWTFPGTDQVIWEANEYALYDRPRNARLIAEIPGADSYRLQVIIDATSADDPAHTAASAEQSRRAQAEHDRLEAIRNTPITTYNTDNGLTPGDIGYIRILSTRYYVTGSGLESTIEEAISASLLILTPDEGQIDPPVVEGYAIDDPALVEIATQVAENDDGDDDYRLQFNDEVENFDAIDQDRLDATSEPDLRQAVINANAAEAALIAARIAAANGESEATDETVEEVVEEVEEETVEEEVVDNGPTQEEIDAAQAELEAEEARIVAEIAEMERLMELENVRAAEAQLESDVMYDFEAGQRLYGVTADGIEVELNTTNVGLALSKRYGKNYDTITHKLSTHVKPRAGIFGLGVDEYSGTHVGVEAGLTAGSHDSETGVTIGYDSGDYIDYNGKANGYKGLGGSTKTDNSFFVEGTFAPNPDKSDAIITGRVDSEGRKALTLMNRETGLSLGLEQGTEGEARVNLGINLNF